MTGYVIGVDIGATKIASGLIHGTGRLLRTERAPTPYEGRAAVLTTVADLVNRLRDGVTVDAVGVGAPGVIDPRIGAVVSATSLMRGWAGTPVREELERRTGLPVTVDNDVRAMACGELHAGAARGFGDVLYVSVGTGIGGGITRGGRLHRGGHGTAGEIAHLLVPTPGPIRCGCGRLDHLEAYAAGPAIAAAYTVRAGGDPVALPEVVRRMRAGDADARAAVRSAATVLGRTLAGLVTAIDVDAVVVGGGVAQIGEDFLHPLTDALHAEVLPPLRDVPVLAAGLGTDAPLIGAAMLAVHHLAGADR